MANMGTRAGTWALRVLEGFTHNFTSISHRPLPTRHTAQTSNRCPGPHASSLSSLIFSAALGHFPKSLTVPVSYPIPIYSFGFLFVAGFIKTRCPGGSFRACPGHTSPSPTLISCTGCILQLEEPLFFSQLHASYQTKFKGHFNKLFPHYWVNHSFFFYVSLFLSHVLLEYLRFIALDFVSSAWPLFVCDEEVPGRLDSFFTVCPSL